MIEAARILPQCFKAVLQGATLLGKISAIDSSVSHLRKPTPVVGQTPPRATDSRLLWAHLAAAGKTRDL